MAKETYDTGRKRLLIHPGEDPTNKSAIYLDENSVVITDAENKHSIQVTRSDGIGFQGPLSIQTTPDQIRFAAMWKINPLVLTAIPSTVYTPIPWLRKAPLTVNKEMVKGIVSIAKLLTAIV
jgi:hypothetical protein